MSANPDRVREIFGNAARLPEDARAAYIRVACGHDAALQDEVESLLKQANSSTTQLADDQPPSNPMIGVQVGQYIIKSVIGSGGMGIVYRCIQQSPRRTVAIKMMKQGVASRNALRRFEFESQALGRLRHENIAQIYEASTWDDGSGARPFFAMEYLAGGMPITQYAREKELDTHNRLKMFMKVCDAVQHGHQKGIIHRDLKPHNILVTSNSVPKIIDFGVARSTDSDMAATTLQSDIGALIGTLQYMSPEQCGGDPSDIDVRSDVYTLGVVLYELLCESLPYDVNNIGIAEAVRIVQQNQPAKPSTVNKHLRGDIETVVMMALEKDRDRRYQTAVELKQDIDRYLTNRPIAARRPSAWYHIKRFAIRHRATAAAMIISVGILLASIVAISMLWLDATRAQLLSEDNARQADIEATKARMATAEAEREAKKAEDARDQAQRADFYASTMAAATAAEVGAWSTADTFLEQARKNNLPDLDQIPFEIQYLKTLIDSEDASDVADSISLPRGTDNLPRVTAIAVSPDGGRIASGYDNGTIGIFDTVMFEFIVTLVVDHDGPRAEKVRSLSFNCDGTKLASTTADAIHIWDTRTGKLSNTLDSPNETPFCKAIFSPEGHRLAHIGETGTVHIWKNPEAKQVANTNPYVAPVLTQDHSFTRHHSSAPPSISFNFEGTQLAVGDDKGNISLLDIETNKPTHLKADGYMVQSIAFHPNGDQLIIGAIGADEIDGNKFAKLLIYDITKEDINDPHNIVDLGNNNKPLDSIAFSPDGTRLAVATVDLITLWDLDLEEGNPRQVFFFSREGADSQVVWNWWNWSPRWNRDSIVFGTNNNSDYLASSGDKKIHLWHTRSRSSRTTSMLEMYNLETGLEELAEKLIRRSIGDDDIVDDDIVLLLLEEEKKKLNERDEQKLSDKEQIAIQNLVLKQLVAYRKQQPSKTEPNNTSSTLPVAQDARSEPKTTLQSTRENDQDPGD